MQRKYLYATVGTGYLLGMTAGISLSWTSPVNPSLADENNLKTNPLGRTIDADEQSWLVSVLPLGAIIGPFLSGYVADKFGRRSTLLACCALPYIASYITLAFATNLYVYYVARFVQGSGVGASLTGVNLYHCEIAEDSIRGRISSGINVFLATGLLFSYVVGPNLTIPLFCVSCAMPPLLFAVTFFFIAPESPYYFVIIKDFQRAEESLKLLRSHANAEEIQSELRKVKFNVEESFASKTTLKNIFKKKGLTKALIISITLMALQQLSGTSVITASTQTIFDATGSSISPTLASIIVGVVTVAITFVPPIIIDRFGRRMLILISAIGMAISEAILGFYFHFKDDYQLVESLFWLPVFCLCFYTIAYDTGLAIVPWTIMGEIFPPDAKSVASSVTSVTCWLTGFIVIQTFNMLVGWIGIGGVFWLYSGFCAFAVPFVLFYVVETNNQSFQDIQDLLNKR